MKKRILLFLTVFALLLAPFALADSSMTAEGTVVSTEVLYVTTRAGGAEPSTLRTPSFT